MAKIKIFLNGDLIEIEKNLNISQLLASLDLDASKIAIEKDLEIIHPVIAPTPVPTNRKTNTSNMEVFKSVPSI